MTEYRYTCICVGEACIIYYVLSSLTTPNPTEIRDDWQRTASGPSCIPCYPQQAGIAIPRAGGTTQKTGHAQNDPVASTHHSVKKTTKNGVSVSVGSKMWGHVTRAHRPPCLLVSDVRGAEWGVIRASCSRKYAHPEKKMVLLILYICATVSFCSSVVGTFRKTR